MRQLPQNSCWPCEGERTEEGMRANIRVAVQYIEAWISGNGCVPIYGLMEDAATAEISRTSIWQWIHHQKTLSNGKPVTKPLFRQMLAEEMLVIQDELGEHRYSSGRFDDAARLMEQITTSDELIDFLTLPVTACWLNSPHNNMEHLHMKTRNQQIEELQKEWTQPRWEGITRPYSAEDVVKLRGSVNPECTLAQLGAAKMWRLLHGESKKGYINSLGALTGGGRCNRRKPVLKRFTFLAGRWRQMPTASSMYPDQSLYPANSVPAVVDRINNTFRRADQINGQAVLSRTIRATWITSCRSLPMRKRALAGF